VSEVFVVFLSVSRQMLTEYFKMSHKFFVIHRSESTCHSTLCNISSWYNVVEGLIQAT
jgi:hypothetical protein